ncbi:MAG: nucleotidyl transferase AbiEii/AbiGii toxin family protein [Hydrococcus sp. SU_1_0]|nr:nucleotidyl transferase AbiEii/AbiGii toxin family protein [Hydrococcus sp. SU_1_0]NJO98526.1 nucleotidyl transferase AbiEii/AbiGii toxin family protein [Pleurocapsa sp. CRU_1_2]
MNQAFKRFLDLDRQDRQGVFEATAEELNTVPIYVEKDFWVCFILDILFNEFPKESPRLLFKGGTSLSKVYQIINRFSEDVDFVVFRDDLGFDGDKDPCSLEISNKKRQKLSKKLAEEASDYICNQLKNDLERSAAIVSPDCSVALDENDKSTLLFQYPSLFVLDNNSYVQPRIKLEGGARSALDPHEKHMIQPFIANELQGWDFSIPNITTISLQRTFWDKIMILHGWSCGYRDDKNRLPTDAQRLSRHYYDVATIYKTDIGRNAVDNAELRESVRQHTENFFYSAWRKLDQAVPGSITIVPKDELRKILEKDYQAMQGMMLGDIPDFKEIVEEIAALEGQINESSTLE